MSEKLEELKKKVNPFTENPNLEYAKLWDKINENSIGIAENRKDCEWLKKGIILEILIAFLTLLGVLYGIGVIKI